MASRIGRLRAAMLLTIGAIHFAFFIHYPVPDQFTFFVPTLFVMACIASVGMTVIADWRPRLLAISCVAAIVVSPLAYALLPPLIRVTSPELVRNRRLPYRDELSYWIVPWKWNENSAQRFADEVLHSVSNDAVILADPTTANALRAFDAIHGRPTRRKIVCKSEFTRLDSEARERAIARWKKGDAYVVAPANLHANIAILEQFERYPAGLLERITPQLALSEAVEAVP